MRLLKTAVPTFVVLAGAAAGVSLPACTADRKPAAVAEAPATTAISGLGRIEPGDGVVRLGARSLSGQPSIVSRVLVHDGDEVRTGQVLAELDSTAQLRATFLLGKARVEVARRRLEQVEASAKPSDIAAQRAEVDRLGVELEQAQRELRRYEALQQARSVADARVDEVRLRVEGITRLLRQANERLASLSEPRPVDVEVARAEVEASLRDAARQEAEYDASLVRSPLDGRVLKIHARPGEEVGPKGVMELASVDVMYVLAEIAETDMWRVRRGQRATISGPGLPATLTGTVETVGAKVTEDSVMQISPAEFSDARVVEVRIRLNDGQAVTDLIHLRVKVVIDAPATPDRPDAR